MARTRKSRRQQHGSAWHWKQTDCWYLADLTNTASPEWVTLCKAWLNEFCGYCGALTVQELKKKHLRTWLQKHKTWNSNTQRNVIACIKAAFKFLRFFGKRT